MDVAELPLRLGEGDNVGRIIPVQVLLVDGPDLLIVNQYQTDFTAAAVQFPQDFIDCLSQPS